MNIVDIIGYVDRAKFDSEEVKSEVIAILNRQRPEYYILNNEKNQKVKIVYEGKPIDEHTAASKLNNMVYTKWIKDSHDWAQKNCDGYDECNFDCECCYYALTALK